MRRVPLGYRVRLRSSLAHRVEGLVAGREGEVIEAAGRSAMFPERFTRVRFDGTELDVLLANLDVIDPRWEAEKDRLASEQRAALDGHVKIATLLTTRAGGFVELRVEYSNGREPDTWKRRAECSALVADLHRRGLLEEKRFDGIMGGD